LKGWLLERLRAYSWCIKSRARAFSFAWATLIGSLVASRGIPPLLPALGAVIVGSVIALSIYIFNDVMDLDVDRINLVDRPIAQEKVSKREALSLAFFLTAVGAVLSLFINLTTFLLCVAGIALGFAYSTRPTNFRDRFLLKQLSIAGGALISSLTGGAAVGTLSWSVLFAGLMFFAYAVAMSPIVDLGDIEGDRKRGRKTLPIVWGPEYTIRLAMAIMLSMMVAGIVGYYQLGFNLALPTLVSLVCLACVWVLYPLLGRWQDSQYCRILVKKWIFLHFMLQLSIVIGAI